jgi:hypothetical protein
MEIPIGLAHFSPNDSSNLPGLGTYLGCSAYIIDAAKELHTFQILLSLLIDTPLFSAILHSWNGTQGTERVTSDYMGSLDA